MCGNYASVWVPIIAEDGGGGIRDAQRAQMAVKSYGSHSKVIRFIITSTPPSRLFIIYTSFHIFSKTASPSISSLVFSTDKPFKVRASVLSSEQNLHFENTPSQVKGCHFHSDSWTLTRRGQFIKTLV